MKKILTGATLLACVMNFSYAQSPQTTKKRCGSAEIYQQMLQNDPQFARNQKQIEEFTQNFIRNGGSASETSKTGAVIYTIPVVVHVVYKTTAQNISDAQINSQITALNKDYQKLNSDVSKVPSVWQPLVADIQVKFCLATINPTGGATNGIVRKSTTTTSFTDNDNVKFSSKGGDDAWDSKKYLNLWVCNLGSGLLGYAQFPGGKVTTDGVVIDYTAFGTTGAAAYPYNLGRTATHEIGHWLNLRHIWGDDGTACTGSDLVGDTPNQADEHYGCATFPAVSCSNGPNGDMFMNYMDYSDDRCMYMFTTGQKDRMQATLKTGGSRNSVTTSGKCGAQPPQFIHTSAASINVVPNPVVSGVATVTYKLENAANIQLLVSDMYGNAQKNINIGAQTAGSYNIQPAELSQLKDGVYLIKLIANGEEIATTRFMVSR